MGAAEQFPPELRLIIGCLRRFVAAQSGRAADSVSAHEFPAGSIDWQRVIESASWHRVLPIVNQQLQSEVECPATVLRESERRTRALAGRVMVQMAELTRLAESFQQRDIDFLVLKGLPLARELYGNLMSRTSCDIDILVRPCEVANAFSCLLDLGYTSNIDREALGRKGLTTLFRLYSTKDVSLFAKSNRLPVELHWRVTHTHACFPLSAPELLEGRRLIDMARTKVPVMPKEATGLYLCYHGSNHVWHRLRWLCDIALFFQRVDVEWENVGVLAKRFGIEPTLGMAVVLVDTILKMPAPRVLAANKGLVKAGQLFVQHVVRHIVDEKLPNTPAYGSLLAWQFRMQSSNWNRLCILLRHACPNNRDIESFRFPEQLAGLYLLARPARIMTKVLAKTRR